jgi:hypothetical protein
VETSFRDSSQPLEAVRMEDKGAPHRSGAVVERKAIHLFQSFRIFHASTLILLIIVLALIPIFGNHRRLLKPSDASE